MIQLRSSECQERRLLDQTLWPHYLPAPIWYGPTFGPVSTALRPYPGPGPPCGRPDPIILIRHLNQLL
jgi:hypothetical protein